MISTRRFPVWGCCLILAAAWGCSSDDKPNKEMTVEECLDACGDGCPAPEYWVCASDGQRYCNECIIDCYGLEVVADGSGCDAPCPDGLEQVDGESSCLQDDAVCLDMGDGLWCTGPADAPCEGDNPQGCLSHDDCGDAMVCDNVSGNHECTSSSCFCDLETASWACTPDCMGGVCLTTDDCVNACGDGCPAPEHWVCASNGQRYCNECTINCNGLEVVEDGSGCDSPCPDGLEQVDGESDCLQDDAVCLDMGDGLWCTGPADALCEGDSPQGCLSHDDCGDAMVCDNLSGSHGCRPSHCLCDAESASWTCSPDCRGGVCLTTDDCLDACGEGCPAPDFWVCASDGERYCNECIINCYGLEVVEDWSGCDSPCPDGLVPVDGESGCLQDDAVCLDMGDGLWCTGPADALCEGDSPQGCLSHDDCGDAMVCDNVSGSHGCISSSCSCDAEAASWLCSPDCMGGVCLTTDGCLDACGVGCPAPEHWVCASNGTRYCNECIVNCYGFEVMEDDSYCDEQ